MSWPQQRTESEVDADLRRRAERAALPTHLGELPAAAKALTAPPLRPRTLRHPQTTARLQVSMEPELGHGMSQPSSSAPPASSPMSGFRRKGPHQGHHSLPTKDTPAVGKKKTPPPKSKHKAAWQKEAAISQIGDLNLPSAKACAHVLLECCFRILPRSSMGALCGQVRHCPPRKLHRKTMIAFKNIFEVALAMPWLKRMGKMVLL